MKRKNLALFLVVCFSTAILLTVGWAIGYLVGGIAAFIGAMIGGIVGSIIGAEVSFKKGLVEANWDVLLWKMTQIGLGIGSMVAFMNTFSGITAAVMAILGAGFGALLAKYLLRFFIHEEPPKIF